jgi:hypothetical protein
MGFPIVLASQVLVAEIFLIPNSKRWKTAALDGH